jgi:hypothetical protein
MVAQASWDKETRKIVGQKEPGQKVHETLFQPMTGCGGTYPSSTATPGSSNRRVMGLATLDVQWDPISRTEQKEVRAWLKKYSTYLASMSALVQSPAPQNKFKF